MLNSVPLVIPSVNNAIVQQTSEDQYNLSLLGNLDFLNAIQSGKPTQVQMTGLLQDYQAHIAYTIFCTGEIQVQP